VARPRRPTGLWCRAGIRVRPGWSSGAESSDRLQRPDRRVMGSGAGRSSSRQSRGRARAVALGLVGLERRGGEQ
jgi:hypothetical protein